MTTSDNYLPNLNGNGKRAALERALHVWRQRGAFSVAMQDPDRPDRYRVCSGDGTLWEGLTVKEALLLVHGAASAWTARERREGAQPAQPSKAKPDDTAALLTAVVIDLAKTVDATAEVADTGMQITRARIRAAIDQLQHGSS